MKTVGKVLLVAGILGTVIFGIQAMQNSETMNLFGLNIALSSANWTPVIISAIVLVIGILMTSLARK